MNTKELVEFYETKSSRFSKNILLVKSYYSMQYYTVFYFVIFELQPYMV